MSKPAPVIRNLAAAFLAGPWVLAGLVERGAHACGRRDRWLRALARRVLRAFPGTPTPPDEDTLAHFIQEDKGFEGAMRRYDADLGVRQVFWAIPAMAPSRWPVPALATPGALAEWLGLTPTELDWFADCQGREADVPVGPLRHYTYRWLARRSGRPRLLEMPKQRLKGIQRRLLHDLLDRLPAHEAAHGYRRGRSVVSYAAPHTGRAIVLRLDLRDFFPSVRGSRIHALFRAAGYPTPVARLLTGLCTNVVPQDVCQGIPGGCTAGAARLPLYHVPHLPQGAPTSPALANLCAYRLDCRLAALAKAVDARYTRYADDLAFSGGDELERSARRFQVQACCIALEEGFEVHTPKTRFMRQGVRQQLAGVVLNVHPNIQRVEYDRLKAILHNCLRHGPSSQNREGHTDFRAYLAGRIAYVAMLNAARGHRLRSWFEQIRWSAEP